MCDDTEALAELKEALKLDIMAEDSISEIEKVTGPAVKNAARRIKPSKGDVTGSYNSDMIKNCPDSFFDMLNVSFVPG